MKSYLQQLENNEAILLMYIAGELPDADRQEVEQMLASDATLRGELEILRQTQQLAFDALESLDELERPTLRPGGTQERISKLMSEWLVRRQDAANRDSAAKRMPWRRIGFAVAAVLLVGYYIFAVYDHLDSKPQGIGSPVANNNNDDSDGLPYTRPARTLTSDEKVALLSNSLEDSNADESDLHIAEVAAVVPSDAESTDGHPEDSSAVGEP